MNKQCGACGARQLAPFENETFEIQHQGRKSVVEGLSGMRCSACGEVTFDLPGAQRYAAASDALLLEARAAERETIKRIRLKLGLTQEQAAFLTGGGPNAFSRYETGKARPLAAVVHLFYLLDAHPELLHELPEPPAKPRTGRKVQLAGARQRAASKPVRKASGARRRSAAGA